MQQDIMSEFVKISKLLVRLRELLSQNSTVFKFFVMKHGKPVAVVLSIAEYELLLESVRVEGTLPSTMVDYQEYKQVRRGETDEYETVAGDDD